MLVLTSPVERSWNDLAIHPLFVQFIAEAARYLVRGDASAASTIVGSPVATGLTAAGGGQIFDPRGRARARPGTEHGRGSPDSRTQTGFYEIRGNDGVRWVAVNVDARESDLAPLPADFVAALAGHACAGPRPTSRRLPVREDRKPRSLGPVAALARGSVTAGGSAAGESLPGHPPGDTEMSARMSDSKVTCTPARPLAHTYLCAAAASPWQVSLRSLRSRSGPCNSEEFAPAITIAGRIAIIVLLVRCRCESAVAAAAAARTRGRRDTFSNSGCRKRMAASRPISTANVANRRASDTAARACSRPMRPRLRSARRPMRSCLRVASQLGGLIAGAALVVLVRVARRRSRVLGLRQPSSAARHGLAAQCRADPARSP